MKRNEKPIPSKGFILKKFKKCYLEKWEVIDDSVIHIVIWDSLTDMQIIFKVLIPLNPYSFAIVEALKDLPKAVWYA